MTKKLLWFVLFSFIFVMSCSNNKAKPRKQSGTAHMEFDNTKYDFGSAMEGEALIIEFSFKNTGNAPLHIERIQSSCGCTVAEYPEFDIKPSEEGIVKAIFDTGGFKGYQYKTLTVYSNADNSPVKLEITGVIQ